MRPKQYLELKKKLILDQLKYFKIRLPKLAIEVTALWVQLFQAQGNHRDVIRINCSNLSFLTLKSDVGTQELKISYKNYYQVCFHVPGSFWE